jgi:FMN phosphatase YigB (HAD superfamily)
MGARGLALIACNTQSRPPTGYDLDSIFDAVVISGDTGTRKPDAAIQLIATDELGVPPRSGRPRSARVFSDENPV